MKKIFVVIDHAVFPATEKFYQKKQGEDAKRISKSKWFDLYHLSWKDEGIKVLMPLTINL